MDNKIKNECLQKDTIVVQNKCGRKPKRISLVEKRQNKCLKEVSPNGY